jgi:hypothetical protein
MRPEGRVADVDVDTQARSSVIDGLELSQYYDMAPGGMSSITLTSLSLHAE